MSVTVAAVDGRLELTEVHRFGNVPVTVRGTLYWDILRLFGTWSLAGLELPAPVLTEESRLANFTNEAGIDGTIRYLRNVTGLWLLQECLRCWPDASLGSLLAEAGRLPALRFVIDPDDPVFLPPGDMPARILSWLAGRGQPVPSGPAEIARCILDSLALAYRRALESAQQLSGRHADVVHIVGGGARNELLCQLTADATPSADSRAWRLAAARIR